MIDRRDLPLRRAGTLAPARRTQSGVALATTAILLTLVMLLAYGTARIAGNQLRIGANKQFQSIALNRAEGAVATAESWLGTAPNNANIRSAGFRSREAATPHIYPAGFLAAANIDPLTMTWTASNSLAVDGTSRYLIELVAASKSLPGDNGDIDSARVGPCRKMNVFRIWSLGDGDRGAERVVESLYAVPNCV